MTGVNWLAFTPDITTDRACAIYAARYGVQPCKVLTTGGAMLVGPIPSLDLVQPSAPTGAQDTAPGQLALFVHEGAL